MNQMLYRRTIVVFLTLITLSGLSAFADDYWQQEISYEMDLELNVPEKRLDATSQLTYINHSPDTLRRLYMHLMPNAFNDRTILDLNWRSQGYIKFQDEEWTGITLSSLDGQDGPLVHQIVEDVLLRIELPRQLAPADTFQFALEWDFKVHDFQDRSGWEDGQFDFAQWYPKFVVYDDSGWNLDPFADLGEFYGEFATFDVEIDLPYDHIVAATGVVVEGDPGWDMVTVDTSQGWTDWLAAFLTERDSLLAEVDSLTRRKVRFHAERVHDFAWLTSPDLVYEHGGWDGIDIHVLYDHSAGKRWSRETLASTERCMEFFCNRFGRYPYPQFTVTKSHISGGMEYPMLVMNGYFTEHIVAHELAHNWFYGIFANNEYDEPWLDEGITSFAEDWYISQYYPGADWRLESDRITQFEYDHLPNRDFYERGKQYLIAYLLSAENEPPSSPGPYYGSYSSYYVNAYYKGSMMLYTLRNYLGEERFLAAMRSYYDQWALKHVTSERFIKSLEDAVDEDLDWFFDQWLYDTGWIDYALDGWAGKRVEDHYVTRVGLKRIGAFSAPVNVRLLGEDGQTADLQLEDFRFRPYAELEFETDFKPVRVLIDPDDVWLDVDRRNNDSERQFDWIYDYPGWREDPRDAQVMALKPLLTYNDAGGVTPGLSLRSDYRGLFDHYQGRIWWQTESSELDWNLIWERPIYGYSMEMKSGAEAGHWNGMLHAEIYWDLFWQKSPLRSRPNHWVVLGLDHTDIRNSIPGFGHEDSYSRFYLSYQHARFLKDHDMEFGLNLSSSIPGLGTWAESFMQLGIYERLTLKLESFKIVSMLSIGTEYGKIPAELGISLAGQSGRDAHLDQLASFLSRTDALSTLGGHLYLPSAGSFRGFIADGNVPVPFIWTESLDVSRDISLPGIMNKLSFGMFMDLGQISDDGVQWTTLGDAGFQMKWKPRWRRTNWVSTLIRPFELELIIPVARYADNDFDESQPGDTWSFTFKQSR